MKNVNSIYAYGVVCNPPKEAYKGIMGAPVQYLPFHSSYSIAYSVIQLKNNALWQLEHSSTRTQDSLKYFVQQHINVSSHLLQADAFLAFRYATVFPGIQQLHDYTLQEANPLINSCQQVAGKVTYQISLVIKQEQDLPTERTGKAVFLQKYQHYQREQQQLHILQEIQQKLRQSNTVDLASIHQKKLIIVIRKEQFTCFKQTLSKLMATTYPSERLQITGPWAVDYPLNNTPITSSTPCEIQT